MSNHKLVCSSSEHFGPYLPDGFATIPVDIYELGLIYSVDIDDDRNVQIDMTLTAPGCPVAGDMPGWVQSAAQRVKGVNKVNVDLVFDPPWDVSRMSDEARLALNML